MLINVSNWYLASIVVVMVLYTCKYCSFCSSHAWVVQDHMVVRHHDDDKNVKIDYRNPRAPTTVSVGPGGSRVRTTISVPPVRGGSGIQPYVQGHHIPLPEPIAQDPYRYAYAEEELRAPTKVTIQPLQYGRGVDDESMDDDEESEAETESEAESVAKEDIDLEESDAMHIPACNVWDEPRGDEKRDFWEIAEDLRNILNYIKYLRQEYREALPQLRELEGKELKAALKTYAW